MAQKQSYTGTAKFLHWIMAFIWLVAWCISILATHWREELNAHHELTFLHKAPHYGLRDLSGAICRTCRPSPPVIGLGA